MRSPILPKLYLDLASALSQTIRDRLFFYFSYLLEVGKTQDLLSKIWQTVGDTLSN
jgi:hypothetical protein